MIERFLDDRVALHCGDMLVVLPTLAENSIDSCVCDPPYHLTSIVKRFGADNAAPAKVGKTGAYARSSAGFMGKQWDGGNIAFQVETWAQVIRVLKPGGHLIAFSSTRTYHRMACAIEDAGFEIRDQIGWCYGSGFPKSHDVSKGIDRAAGAKRERIGTKVELGVRHNPGRENETSPDYARPWRDDPDAEGHWVTKPATAAAREWQGWGTALKPAWESLVLARKPSAFWDDYDIIGSYLVRLESRLWSMLPAKTAANYFGLSQSEYDAACASAQWSVGERSSTQVASKEAMGMSRYVTAIVSSLSTVSSWNAIWAEASERENTSITETELSTTIGLRTLKSSLSKITPASIIAAHRLGLWSIAHASTAERIFSATVNRLSGTLEQRALAGAIEQCAEHSRDATEISPAWEPIDLARKPLSESTIAANVLKWGTGALNIDRCRIEGQAQSFGNGTARSAGIMGESEPRGPWESKNQRSLACQHHPRRQRGSAGGVS